MEELVLALWGQQVTEIGLQSDFLIEDWTLGYH